MTTSTDGISCRDAALSTTFLLGFGIAFFAIGLTLINRDGCTGLCEAAGLTMLYAGGPVSAVIGVASESVIVAWPLDITMWVVAGFGLARLAARRRIRPWGPALGMVALALTFGLVLSRLVELAV